MKKDLFVVSAVVRRLSSTGTLVMIGLMPSVPVNVRIAIFVVYIN